MHARTLSAKVGWLTLALAMPLIWSASGVLAQDTPPVPTGAAGAAGENLSPDSSDEKQRAVVQQTQRLEIHKPIQLGRDGQFLRDVEIRLAADFQGDFAVVVGNRKKRVRYNRVENVRIVGDPARNIGGILVRYSQATRITGCLIQDCGGSGIKGDAIWNVMISDTIVMNSGWAAPEENASCLMVSDYAHGNEGTNCVQWTNSILESGPRQLVLIDSANFSMAACKLHGVPGRDPRYKPNWPGVFIDNCRGPIALGAGSNTAAWMSTTKPIMLSGNSRPVLKGSFVFAAVTPNMPAGPESTPGPPRPPR